MRSLRGLLLYFSALCLTIPALAGPKPTVTISPGYTTIGASTTQQYHATVSGLANTAVVWKINGVVGGNATLGTISKDGLYHAPAVIPTAQLLVEALASDKVTLGVVYVVLAPAGPAVTSLSPGSIPVGNYTATVSGSGFVAGSIVRAAGVPLSTRFINSTTVSVSGYQGTAGSIAFQAQNPGTLWGPEFHAQFSGPAEQAASPAPAPVASQERRPLTSSAASPSPAAASPMKSAPTGPVSIKIEKPLYGWQVVPGSTRRIHADVFNGAKGQVTWTYTATGGATATITPAKAPNIIGAYIDVAVGQVGGPCKAVGSNAEPVFSSAATVKLTATSVDDPSKSATVPISVCKPPIQVFVSPFNLRLYSGQPADLQSWVWGNANDNVTWTITQPPGGDGKLTPPPAGGSASTSRDAAFSATVAGRYVVTATSVVNPSAAASATLSVDSAALPYAVTRNHTAPVDCSVELSKGEKTYDVGVGHPFANLAAVYHAVGSTILNAGTTIRLFNTDTTGANPTRYHEYLRLDGKGTQAAPIRVVGCADAAGNLPILDAANATAYSPKDNSVQAQIGGRYQISFHHSGTFAEYPTTDAPAYIIVEGLAFRNAYPTTGSTPNNYFAPGSSTPTQWGSDSASCIRPYEGNHVTIRGNDIEDCTFGILADFNGNNAWGGFFGDLDLEGNYFTNVGANNQSAHMAYVQDYRQVIQGNVFDQLKPVSFAGELKMRGVAEVVRYNYFGSSTNTRTIDFVEEQDSTMYMSFPGYYYARPGGPRSTWNTPRIRTPDLLAAADEAWHKVYAYGNVINFGPKTPTSVAPIHFFGDQSAYGDINTNPPARVGDLFDYNNTFYSVGGNSMHLVDTQQNQDNMPRWEWPMLTLWNNAVYLGKLNPAGGVAFQMSTLRSDFFNIGPMWISSNFGTNSLTCSDNTNNACLDTGWPYQQETTQYMDGGNLPAHVSGLSSLIVGGTTAPFNTTTFIPTPNGGLVGAGSALPATIGNMPVRFQITAPSYALTPRTNPLTLGAHD